MISYISYQMVSGLCLAEDYRKLKGLLLNLLNMPYPTNPSSRAKLTTGRRKLGEIIELHYGKGISKHDRKLDGKYPVYGANGILDYSDKFLIDSDAVIVGRKGSAGEVTRVSGKFWPSDVTYYVLGNDKINTDYLFHLFKSLHLQQFAVGVKPGINRNRIYELKIPLPPLAEQKKIVARLEGLLGKIKEAKRLRAEAQEAAQNLLPAELHHIFTKHNTPHKQHTNKLENVRMSGKLASVKNYGEARWEEKELGEVVNIEAKKNTKSLPYVGMEDIESGTGKFIGSKEKRAVRSTTSHFTADHILYGKLRPYLNKFLVPDFEGHCTTEFLPLRPDTRFLTREWLAVWLRHNETVDNIMATTTGSRMPRANMNLVKKFKIPLPPLAEQRKIVARLDSLSEKIRRLQEYQKSTASDFISLEQSILSKSFQ